MPDIIHLRHLEPIRDSAGRLTGTYRWRRLAPALHSARNRASVWPLAICQAGVFVAVYLLTQ